MYATLNCWKPAGPTLPFTDERTEAHELLKPYSHLTAIHFRSSPRQQTLVFSFSAHSCFGGVETLGKLSDSYDISPLLLPLPFPVPGIAVW